MSRAGTLWRLMRQGDRGAIAQVVMRSLFPAWVFRRNVMLIARLATPRPLPRPLPRITIRWGHPDDEPGLRRIRPRDEGYAPHFDAGRLLIVGEVEGRLASFNWFEAGKTHRSVTNGYAFDVGAGGVWAFGFEVDPEFRMSGIFHKHWVVAMELLRERGYHRVYGSIQADNPRSVNSHRRLGFDVLCEFRMIRVFGVETFRVVPVDGSSAIRPVFGFGRWAGSDPAHAPATR